MLLGLAKSLLGVACFRSYALLFGVEDKDNQSEIQLVKIIITISPVLSFIVTLVNIKYNFIEYRKNAILSGMLALYI